MASSETKAATTPTVAANRYMIYDEQSTSENATAFWVEKYEGVKLIALNRKSWSLSDDGAKFVKGDQVMVFGSFNHTLPLKVKEQTGSVTVYVYSEKDRAKMISSGLASGEVRVMKHSSDAMTVQSGKISDFASDPRKLMAFILVTILNQRDAMSEELDHKSKCIAQAVLSRSKFGPLVIDRLRGICADPNESVDKLEEVGGIELNVMDSIINKWISNSTVVNNKTVVGIDDEKKVNVRVCHASPFIIETGHTILARFADVDLVVLHRMEGLTMRFSLMSRSGTGYALKLATRFGGGGNDDFAGCSMGVMDGAAFLSEMMY